MRALISVVARGIFTLLPKTTRSKAVVQQGYRHTATRVPTQHGHREYLAKGKDRNFTGSGRKGNFRIKFKKHAY